MSFALGDIDRRSQMRVANILTCLKWEKVGQQQHLGKRQVVWKPATLPPGVEEIIQQQSQSEQGIATSTIPTTPGSKNISDSVKTEKEQQNKKVRVKSDEGIVEPKSQSRGVDWSSYPYNSGGQLRWLAERDRLTLENRANKVKERILGCGTQNELIALFADGKVSEPEIKWIKANFWRGDSQPNPYMTRALLNLVTK